MERTDRGKWSQSGVPHHGWMCVYAEDLEEPTEICGMCESATIRFIHYMKHPDYPEELGVGCVCAEHMEQDYVTPKNREKRFRTKARRRRTWANRRWKVSARGNIYLNTEGFNLTVFRVVGGYWSFRVVNTSNDRVIYARRRYQTEEKAKHAILDALLWAKEYLQ